MPIRDDFIQRTIEQIAEVIAYMLGTRDQSAFDEAATFIEEAYREHTGSGRALMTKLTSDDLITILSTAGHFDKEKGYLVASLLWAEAQMLTARSMAVPPDLHLKALDLFLESSLEGLVMDDLNDNIVDLQVALEGFLLPEVTLWRLFDHRVKRGGYLGAEDLLFELLERFGPSEALTSRGRAFYRELAEVPEPKLRAGGLDHDGVGVGSEEFEMALAEGAEGSVT
jgi:hypothetical protein